MLFAISRLQRVRRHDITFREVSSQSLLRGAETSDTIDVKKKKDRRKLNEDYITLLFTLDAGPLARCQCSEGPATDHLDTGFLSRFPCVLKANAEVVPKYPRCHYMLLM